MKSKIMNRIMKNWNLPSDEKCHNTCNTYHKHNKKMKIMNMSKRLGVKT